MVVTLTTSNELNANERIKNLVNEHGSVHPIMVGEYKTSTRRRLRSYDQQSHSYFDNDIIVALHLSN